MPQRMGSDGRDKTGTTGKTERSQIIDFSQVRAQRLEEKRRNTERIFFKHLLSVYSIVGDHSMCPIELINVSEEGCAFQIPHNPTKEWPADLKEIPLRLYFSQDTFLEVRVVVANSSDSIENGTRYIRYGCTVDKTVSSYGAYLQFVKFLKTYAEFAQKDTGNVTVFYL